MMNNINDNIQFTVAKTIRSGTCVNSMSFGKKVRSVNAEHQASDTSVLERLQKWAKPLSLMKEFKCS